MILREKLSSHMSVVDTAHETVAHPFKAAAVFELAVSRHVLQASDIIADSFRRFAR